MRKKYWNELTLRKDNNCIVVGEVRVSDESFDHSFGTHSQIGLEFGSMDVFVYVSGLPYKINGALDTKEMDNFVEQFQEYANEEYSKGNVA